MKTEIKNTLSPLYIGDGIYVQVNPKNTSCLVLTTRSHFLNDADNIIYLEEREARSLYRYIKDFLLFLEERTR